MDIYLAIICFISQKAKWMPILTIGSPIIVKSVPLPTRIKTDTVRENLLK